MVVPVYRYRAECVRVVDGDTYHLRIDLGFRVSITVPVRLRGVNCPELGTEEGKAARRAAHFQLTARELVVESYRDRQSFARWVADVYVDGESLAGRLIAAGHGVAA